MGSKKQLSIETCDFKGRIFGDSHIHSEYSPDSKEPLEKIIQSAIQKKMKYLSVTDHFDATDEVGGYPPITNAYLGEIKRLQEKYSDQIDFLFGVEIGFHPGYSEQVEKIAAHPMLDFVIGSGHEVFDEDPFFSSFYDHRTEREGYHLYFEGVLEYVKNYHFFDSLGHLDYMIRYSAGKEATYHISDHWDVIEPILETLIKKDKAMEINTASWAKGLANAHPHPTILKRFREMGGEKVTVGSDAHMAKMVGYGFSEVRNLLLDAGFDHYVYYKKRRPIRVFL